MRTGIDPAGRLLVAGVLVVALFTRAPRAQVPAGGDVQSQLDDLRRRNDVLETRVAELEGQKAATGEEVDAGGLVARFGEVTATFNVFGDVGFNYDNPERAGRAHTGFYLGSVDFFANVQLGDRFRVLSESVLERRGTSDAVAIDQERLWAMWTFDDRLYLKLGTEHSPVSRWNQLYHHGHWLETSITRPYLARFEGDDGILAMHATGLEVGGRLHPSAGGIEWFAAASNGRGLQPVDKQRSWDRNDGKKIDVGVAFEPAVLRDLRVGGAFTFDEIPAIPSSTVPGRALSIREVVLNANVQYRLGSLDLLSEFAWIEHDVRATRTSSHHHSGYLQAAWRAGAVIPFARFDYRTMARDDPFYNALDRDLDAWRQVLGVRYDATENVATKLEVGFARAEERGAGGVQESDIVSVALQVSWVF